MPPFYDQIDWPALSAVCKASGKAASLDGAALVPFGGETPQNSLIVISL
jgi:hypothetical protein